jgi:hypothetical protein
VITKANGSIPKQSNTFLGSKDLGQMGYNVFSRTKTNKCYILTGFMVVLGGLAIIDEAA